MIWITNTMILLLIAAKRSGKDTCAKYLSQKYNFTHKKISQRLKDSLKVLFQFDDDQIEGLKKDEIDERYNVTPRDTMKWLGTTIFQYEISKFMPFKRDFWISQLVPDLNRINTDIVLSDVRFQHEIDYIKKHTQIPIYSIYIDRYEIDEKDETEKEMKKMTFDCIITNRSSYSDLYNELDKYVLTISRK